MTGFGPANASMGGAGVAAAIDTSALVLNPATLADLDARVDFGAAYFPTTVSYSATNNYLNPALPPQLQQLGGLIVNKPNQSIKVGGFVVSRQGRVEGERSHAEWERDEQKSRSRVQ